MRDKKKSNLDAIKKSDIYSPLFTGRPEREKTIIKDEMVNLAIALGTCVDVQEFIDLL